MTAVDCDGRARFNNYEVIRIVSAYKAIYFSADFFQEKSWPMAVIII